MAKHPTKATTALVSIESPLVYELDGEMVQLVQFFDKSSWKQEVPHGVWMDEPSKIAWKDETTGLDCIIRRAWSDCLGGYVGVDERHPLFGYGCRALNNAFDIEVHGGLVYSRACDDAGPEEQRICHSGEPARSHSHMWWFGFECDHSYDAFPSTRLSARSKADRGVYRDINYVYRQTTQLAAQLRAIANGDPMPKPACPPPPIALDHRDLGEA